MKHIRLFRGLPGSGKTTAAVAFGNKLKVAGIFSTHREADLYFVMRGNGVYKFDPALIGAAHRYCQERVERDMAMHVPYILVANTFCQVWEMQPYVDLANRYKYILGIETLRGNYNNLHGVPDTTIEKMRKRWEELPKDWSHHEVRE